MRLFATTAFVFSVVAYATSAFAAVPLLVDPAIERSLTLGISSTDAAARFGRHPGLAPVLLTLRPALAASDYIGILKATGAALSEVDGKIITFGRFVGATVDRVALTKLKALPELERVSLFAWHAQIPLDASASLLGLPSARGSRLALGHLTGKGITVADQDTNVDISHPQFFRGDAGYYTWLDVNNDGLLTPDVDGVDLDGDGKISKSEVLHVVFAETTPKEARSPLIFDPGLDWLYLDTNLNGVRDFGPEAGFVESTPGYGEPLFAPDDLNRDGTIDVREKLVQLGTSKFKKVYVSLGPYAKIKHVFTRGIDLITLKNSYTAGRLYGYSDALHASGALSIVGADLPLLGRKHVGIAPEADLLLGWNADPMGLQRVLTWALSEKPDVMFHEMAPWTGAAMDGSDAYSTVLDTSVTRDKVTHACPTGNIGGSEKHGQLKLAKRESKTIDLVVPDNTYYVDIGLNVRGGNATYELAEPGGTKHSGEDGTATLSDGSYFDVRSNVTDRGTLFHQIVLAGATEGSSLPAGTYKLTVKAEASISWDGYVSDDKSGFGKGARWDSSIASDKSTMAWPSTADHCIAVGAFAAHPYTKETPWWWDGVGGSNPYAIRTYSARGPRIDGVDKMDVVAPDNPWTAFPHGKNYNGDDTITPHGGVFPFGGTSGAVPHVAGVAALLAQAGLLGDVARDAIRKGAIHDAFVGASPNATYGYGRLSAAGALGSKDTYQAPKISLKVADELYLGEPFTVVATVEDLDGVAAAAEIRWDDNYDGTWDQPYTTGRSRTFTISDAATTLFVKAQVRDSQGLLAEAAVRLVAIVKPPPPPEPKGCGCRVGLGNESFKSAAELSAISLLVFTLGIRRKRAA